MRITYEHFIDHLNKKEKRELKNDWKSVAKGHEQEIFSILNTDKKYNTGFDDKKELLDGYKPWTKRIYKDEYFERDIIYQIKKIKKTNLKRSTENKIIKLYEEIQALQKALDSSRPQSNPLTLIRDEKGQGRFNFFPEEETTSISIKQEEKDQNNRKTG